MAVQDYKINYKSDFVLTINGDAGWAVPFCIKFWTGMPSQAYFVGFDGVKYVNCRVGDTPTQLLVMFDDHHLPIGPLRMQIAYHTTIEEFPGSVFDEVTNARDVIVTIDGTDYQVMLDFTGEDAPELEFNLPAYANEAERIQNELQRQQNEADRIAAELQREQATAAAVQGAENVNAQLNGTTLTVTNRNGVSTSVNTKGEQGEQGPVGPEGPQGEQGVSIVSFRPVYESGTTIYYVITFSDGHDQSVAIPKGAKGDTGATGPQGPQGPQGDTGVSITGFVETGETETDTLYNITFSNGTTQAVAIPKGEKGDQGPVGPQGPQGPMGDVAVITPEQQAAFTMYSVPGQNTNGPMTQKAVTDALVAGSISYENLQSGLASNNVQGALDEVVGDTTYSNDVTLTSDLVRNYNINAEGKYVRSGDNYQCWVIQVYSGEKYKVKANSTVRAHLAFMASDPTSPTNNTPADFIEGYDGRFSVNIGEVESFTVPESSGNIYLYIQKKTPSNDNTPDFLEKMTGVKEKIASLKAEDIIYYNSNIGRFDAKNVKEAIDKVSDVAFSDYKKNIIPLTHVTDKYIAGGLWVEYEGYGGYLIPFEDTENYYRIQARDNVNSLIVALLNDNAVPGSTPSYVTGDSTSSIIPVYSGGSTIFKLPLGTKYIWIRRLQNNDDVTPRIEKLQSISDYIGEIEVADIINGKGLNNDGTFFDATSAGAAVNKYRVIAKHKYEVSGYSPSDNDLTKVSIVCTDENGIALESYKPCRSSAFIDYVIETPADCAYLLVFGNASAPASLKKYHNTIDNEKIESIPQIYNNGYNLYRGSNLKILCFGSSWFMDTWWYLNKLLGNAGVQCELHCYYMGHAKMREWLEFYNGNTTPFSGTEATRSASKNISVNGADWTISTYSQSGTYNAESYKNDFVADIKSGDWDIIAFQQGAQECIIAEEWEARHDVVKMIKENCTYKTTIAFNATFTPALKNYAGIYFPTISRSDYGKEYYQYLNNRYTKLFIADTGIYNVSPNGAMLSLMRTDQTLNLSNDMASDGLHPDNGLPILGLCGCFYETFIGPIIGKSFDELDWLPTSSTQKARVSGDSFQSCNTGQLATIKKYVKQALADRFKYYK